MGGVVIGIKLTLADIENLFNGSGPGVCYGLRFLNKHRHPAYAKEGAVVATLPELGFLAKSDGMRIALLGVDRPFPPDPARGILEPKVVCCSITDRSAFLEPLESVARVTGPMPSKHGAAGLRQIIVKSCQLFGIFRA